MGGCLGRTPPSESVLDQLPIPAGGAPSTTAGRTLLRTEATVVLDAMALARTPPGTGDSLAGLHAAWKLLHDLDQWTLDRNTGPAPTCVPLSTGRVAALPRVAARELRTVGGDDHRPPARRSAWGR
ncbi:hypothetical protein, partial [Streptomyces flaveolus]|uniref:hypothetical protein n=1 Tax=Streptomyces flaveolus TaxID=67297 RepID=UPI0033EEB412